MNMDQPQPPEIKLDDYDDNESIQRMRDYYSERSTSHACELATLKRNCEVFSIYFLNFFDFSDEQFFDVLQKRLYLLDMKIHHMNQINEEVKYFQMVNTKLTNEVNVLKEENNVLTSKLSKFEEITDDFAFANNNETKQSISEPNLSTSLISSAMNEVHQIVQNLSASYSTMPPLTPVSKLKMKFDGNGLETVESGKKRAHTFR